MTCLSTEEQNESRALDEGNDCTLKISSEIKFRDGELHDPDCQLLGRTTPEGSQRAEHCISIVIMLFLN